MRLDKYLVNEGYFESRNRANEAIKAGLVSVDGKRGKASSKIDHLSTVEVEASKFYVSRAGRKLDSFLESYPINLKGAVALDVGSSTGGFAQILLERGVSWLDCVDVGSNQLHISLRGEERISLHEGTDIRHFKSDREYGVISCDVSFISVLQILDAIDALASADTQIILLYKPQFEVGKTTKRDAKGVVQDRDAIARAKEKFEASTALLGWREQYQAPSHVQGKEGNQEYLYHFVKVGA
jgi:23S rRNA (cytidine1920-2'-O)/16S rRNA (cytidine1409-2'-O)-methyltransferase